MEKRIRGEVLKEVFAKSDDVLIRPFKLNQNGIEVYMFCVDGLVDSNMMDEVILKNLMYDDNLSKFKTEKETIEYLLSGGAYHAYTSLVEDYDSLVKGVLSGNFAIIFDKEEKAISYDLRKPEKRGISEPEDEGVMKGAKDSFVEVLRSNTAQIRRRIRSEYLVMEQLSVGKLSKTDIALAYLSDVADMQTVNTIRERLNMIDIDNVPTPAFVEEFLVDNKLTIFPQIMYTQRPDRISSNITDGRVAIIVDGIPFVYLLPCNLNMLMQSPEDYANHFLAGSSLRVIRYIALIITLFLPAFYIAATTYQSQMLPVKLALSTQHSKLNVPFTSSAEVLGLLISFEILIESGLRLPKSVGTTMSILGGLVVGQAAVSANLISPAVVVIVSLAGIAGFVMPNQDLSSGIRFTRFVMAILAAIGGFLGMTFGIIFLVIHLCSLDSYGTAYLSPFVDIEHRDYKDTLFRFPVQFFRLRPKDIAPKNKVKQGSPKK